MTLYPWSNFTPERHDARFEYEGALRDIEQRRYMSAASRLEWIVAQPIDHRHGLGDVRELLARSYYHAAQLDLAERTARAVLSDEPTNGYVALLLARTLERQGRHEEAGAPAALARALGVEGA